MQISLSLKIQEQFLSLYKQSLDSENARKFSGFRQLIGLAYSHRSDDELIRQFAECIGWIWLDIYEQNQLYLKEKYFPEKSFAQFATILAENGRESDAVELCQRAMHWNLSDGTKGGFSERITRLKAGKPREVIRSNLNTSGCDQFVKDFMFELSRLHKVTSDAKTVPRLNDYWVQIYSKDLRSNQYEFYKTWIRNWKRGQYLSTDGEEAYVMIYIKENLVTSKKSVSHDRVKELIRLRGCVEQSEPDNRTVIYFCGRFAADSLIYLGDYDRACDVFPQMPLNDFLSLRYAASKPLTGSDLIRVFGVSCLTDFGKEKIETVMARADRVLNQYQEERNNDLLSYWVNRVEVSEFRIFRSIGYYPVKNPKELRFEESEILNDFKYEVAEILREAENLVRDSMGIARIGEGWVSETELYYLIKNSFPQFEVLHHASPDWLGRQHLDIFIPEISLAIEYQGIQHREPVDFFGGKEGFKATKARDIRKRNLCVENKITLLEVESNYDFQDLVDQIEAIAQ